MTAKYNLRVTPWKIRESDFSSMTSFEEKVKFLLKYAVLAPSSHNTQPWKFAIKDERIKVSADLTCALKVADPDERELFISVGCALTNLTIAAKRFGYGRVGGGLSTSVPSSNRTYGFPVYGSPLALPHCRE